jgi:adenylate cyclase
MSRTFHSIAFSLVTALLGVVMLISPLGRYVEREFGLGWLFTLRGPVAPPAEVAVVGINSTSGPELGLSRLPRNWPRSLHGALVKRLMASDVTAVVFDMDFSQPSAPIEDLSFADAIRQAGQVVLFERLEGRNERIISGAGASRWVWVETALPPAGPLAEAARATAPFPLPKIDKSSFQFWAFKPSADDTPTAPAVAVQLALMRHHQIWRDILGHAGVRSELTPPASALGPPGALRDYMKAMRKLFLGQPQLAGHIRDLADAATLVPEEREAVQVLAALYGGPDERFTNLYGPPGTIPTVSYQEVISVPDVAAAAQPVEIAPNEASLRLQGRTVFVGYSDLFSPDQPDRFYTAFTSDRGIDLSGCEIMATAFANLLTDRAIEPVGAALGIGLIVAFGLIVSHAVFWPSAYIALPLVLVMAGAYAIGAAELFDRQRLWLPLVTPLGGQVPFAVVAGLLGQYLVERRLKKRVGAAIAQYLPAHLARDLSEGRLDTASLNQVVHGVCLATDMSGFSRISETKSPRELARFMNDYFEAIARALKKWEVDVTEFHADTIMCAWVGEPGDAGVRRKALCAALEVTRAIESFAADDPGVRLTPRVGLDDGPFYLGHTGGGGRLSYSILGDPANSAARLEGLNKIVGTRILAAASVLEGIDDVVVRPLGEFAVVGKANALSVVEVIGLAHEESSETTELRSGFADAMEAFLAERWDAAAAAFERLAARFPQDRASAFYRDICRRYATGGAPASQPTRLAMTEK